MRLEDEVPMAEEACQWYGTCAAHKYTHMGTCVDRKMYVPYEKGTRVYSL